MAVSFQIIPDRGLTIVTYADQVTIEESYRAAEHYQAHPDYRRGLKFLFDSSAATGRERDYVAFMEFHGRMLDLFADTGRDQLVGIYAPTEVAREMATLAKRSWEPIPHMVIMIHDDEAEVLRFLGQRESSIDALRAPSELTR